MNLSENYSNQVFHDLKEFGLEVTWVSGIMFNVISVETNKTKEELEQHFLIDTASEVMKGSFN